MFSSKSYKSCVYYSNWSVYQKSVPQDADFANITHLFYSFFNISCETGELVSSDPWADYDLTDPLLGKSKGLLNYFKDQKIKFPHLKIFVSVGGWSFRENFKTCWNSNEKRSKFVSSLKKLIQDYHFDGIDFDWEYPENNNESKIYELILKQTFEELAKVNKHLKISMAIPITSESLKFFNFNKFNCYVAFYNVMCYDLSGSWSRTVEFQSNFGRYNNDCLSIDELLNHLTKQIDPRKLIVGIPVYGKCFKGTNGFGRGYASCEDIKFKEIMEKFPNEKIQESSSGKTSFIYNPHEKIFISFDSLESMKYKTNFIIKNKFGGAMFWEFSGDLRKDGLIGTYVKEIGGSKNLEK